MFWSFHPLRSGRGCQGLVRVASVVSGKPGRQRQACSSGTSGAVSCMLVPLAVRVASTPREECEEIAAICRHLDLKIEA